MPKVKVIAEIAYAHQGDSRILHKLVIAAAQSGADGIKFQWFKYDHLATPDYSYYKTYEQLFIPAHIWQETLELAKKEGLEIWVDIFDDWGLELAYKFETMIDGFKIPSTVIQSKKIVESIFSFNKPVLLGVGGWYENELDDFLARLKKENLSNLVLIHGYQGYPTKTSDANLVRISYQKKRYDLPVGLADHEDGSSPLAIELPIYSVFAGATLIEKHLTLNRSLKGHDYYSALEPPEFARMVSKLREAEIAIGTVSINQSERNYLKDSLRVVAKKDICQGEIITQDNTANKRCPSEQALMPCQIAEVLPLMAKKNLQKDEPLLLEYFEQPRITIAVICRLKSTRLAKKALLPIHGIASVERCLLNCLAVPNINQVVLATSYLPEDDPLEQYGMEGRVKVLRGDPDNVASRLIEAAEETDANVILRVTGDCPAVSPEILNILIQAHLKNGSDLTLPTAEHAPGTAGDVYTVASLYRLLRQRKPLTHTEYFSFYFIHNPDLFTVQRVELPEEFKFPKWRLTLDERKDLELLDKIYTDLAVGREPLFLSTLRNYLIQKQELAQTNAHVSLKWKADPTLFEEIVKATTLEMDIPE